MQEEGNYNGVEKRAHPRFRMTFPAFLRLSITKGENPLILELGGAIVDIFLMGVKLQFPHQPEAVSSIEDAKEGPGVDAGVEIVREKKRVKAVGDVRWFQVEGPDKVAVGIPLNGMGREDRKIWEDLVKSMALSVSAIHRPPLRARGFPS